MPTIVETERLIVRPWTTSEEDVADAFAMYSDPAVHSRIGPFLTTMTIDEARSLLAELAARDPARQMGLWAVEEKATGRVVGGVLLQPLTIGGADEIELGYHFASAAWGKGYATEAGQGLLRYGFDTLNLTRIIGIYEPDNEASGHVLRKLGMLDERQVEHEDLTFNLLAIERVSQR